MIFVTSRMKIPSCLYGRSAATPDEKKLLKINSTSFRPPLRKACGPKTDL